MLEIFNAQSDAIVVIKAMKSVSLSEVEQQLRDPSLSELDIVYSNS